MSLARSYQEFLKLKLGETREGTMLSWGMWCWMILTTRSHISVDYLTCKSGKTAMQDIGNFRRCKTKVV
ncbi:hypothetical protein GIB67_023054 [Kingdonia uniflora]|uniref:Uncharacterized protein n=1 Tax=Kingdonia uniflora TaxID=39325 RepID=A0A7J7LBJ8_9MAGN|nr:hypothetical protein GIB67_023054 [Kingdonia uniflora]